MTTSHLTIAMVGNSNVGKSAIFNQLTGLHQHVSNWPGKTVKKAEGTLSFGGYTIDMIDLPGTYSLTAYSGEESVTREYIASGEADAIIDVLDASALERNLFLTIQLLEIHPTMVVALNQVDVAERRGVRLDDVKLAEMLGVPVVKTIGIRNVGLHELMKQALRASQRKKRPSTIIKYSPEIEKRIEELAEALRGLEIPCSGRWMAIRLLEDDEDARDMVYKQKPSLESVVQRLRAEVEETYGHDVTSVLAKERYAIASRVASLVSVQGKPTLSLARDLDRVLLHPVVGYLAMGAVILFMFYGVFVLGDFLSRAVGNLLLGMRTWYDSVFAGDVAAFVWVGAVEGIVAGITVALPYIAPFYVALSLIEDSGYLSRIAFLMDSAMHKLGMHGKGFIPMMLGFGCNVPACLGCRVMETERERVVCAFSASLVPCSARSIVIMGLVAVYVGFVWAILLYVLDILIVFGLGRAAFKLLPGEPTGLIMDMPSYRMPSPRATLNRAWVNVKEFIVKAFPIIIIGNLVIQLANMAGLLLLVQSWVSPVTVLWLGLPPAAAIVLIFGVLRKEMTLILLASLMGTTNFALVLTPAQMIVFAFVVMIYIPCLATIAVLTRELGYRRTAEICVAEIVVAIIAGGILLRVLAIAGIA